ncbi:uncharacterized protein LOC120344762 [Styela clava]
MCGEVMSSKRRMKSSQCQRRDLKNESIFRSFTGHIKKLCCCCRIPKREKRYRTQTTVSYVKSSFNNVDTIPSLDNDALADQIIQKSIVELPRAISYPNLPGCMVDDKIRSVVPNNNIGTTFNKSQTSVKNDECGAIKKLSDEILSPKDVLISFPAKIDLPPQYDDDVSFEDDDIPSLLSEKGNSSLDYEDKDGTTSNKYITPVKNVECDVIRKVRTTFENDDVLSLPSENVNSALDGEDEDEDDVTFDDDDVLSLLSEKNNSALDCGDKDGTTSNKYLTPVKNVECDAIRKVRSTFESEYISSLLSENVNSALCGEDKDEEDVSFGNDDILSLLSQKINSALDGEDKDEEDVTFENDDILSLLSEKANSGLNGEDKNGITSMKYQTPVNIAKCDAIRKVRSTFENEYIPSLLSKNVNSALGGEDKDEEDVTFEDDDVLSLLSEKVNSALDIEDMDGITSKKYQTPVNIAECDAIRKVRSTFENEYISSLLSKNVNFALVGEDKNEEDVTFEDDDILSLLSEKANSALDGEDKDEEDVTFEDDDILRLLSEKANAASSGEDKDGRTSKKYQTPVHIAECDAIRKVPSTFGKEYIPSLLSENVNSALDGEDKDEEDVTFEDDDILSLLSEKANSALNGEDKDGITLKKYQIPVNIAECVGIKKVPSTFENEYFPSLLSENVNSALGGGDKDDTASKKYQTSVKNAECDVIRKTSDEMLFFKAVVISFLDNIDLLPKNGGDASFENDDILSLVSENSALGGKDKDEDDVTFEDDDVLSPLSEKANSALDIEDMDGTTSKKYETPVNIAECDGIRKVSSTFGKEYIPSLLSENVNSALDGEDKDEEDVSFGNDDILSLLSEKINSVLDGEDKDEEDVTFEDDDVLGLLSEKVNSALDGEDKDGEDVTFEDDDIPGLLSKRANPASNGEDKGGITSKKYQIPVNIAECVGIKNVPSTFENEYFPSLLSENVNSALGGGDKDDIASKKYQTSLKNAECDVFRKNSDEMLFFKAVVVSFLNNIDLLPKNGGDVSFENDDILSPLSEKANSVLDVEDKDEEDVTFEDDDVLSLLSAKSNSALDIEDMYGITSKKYQTPVNIAECDAIGKVRSTFENEYIPNLLSNSALGGEDKDEEDVTFEDDDILSLLSEKANSALDGEDKDEEDVTFEDDDILRLQSEKANAASSGEDKDGRTSKKYQTPVHIAECDAIRKVRSTFKSEYIPSLLSGNVNYALDVEYKDEEDVTFEDDDVLHLLSEKANCALDIEDMDGITSKKYQTPVNIAECDAIRKVPSTFGKEYIPSLLSETVNSALDGEDKDEEDVTFEDDDILSLLSEKANSALNGEDKDGITLKKYQIPVNIAECVGIKKVPSTFENEYFPSLLSENVSSALGGGDKDDTASKKYQTSVKNAECDVIRKISDEMLIFEAVVISILDNIDLLPKNGGDASFENDDILSLLSENSNSALDVKDKEDEDVTFEDDDILGLLSEKANSASSGEDKDGITSKKYQTPLNIAECDAIRKVRSTFESEYIPSLLSGNVNYALDVEYKDEEDVTFEDDDVLHLLSEKANCALDIEEMDGITSKKYQTPVNIAECDAIRKVPSTFGKEYFPSLLSETVNSALDGEDKDEEDVTFEDDDILSLLSEKANSALNGEDKDGITLKKYQIPVNIAECVGIKKVPSTFENEYFPSLLSENVNSALGGGDKDDTASKKYQTSVKNAECDVIRKISDEMLIFEAVVISILDNIDLLPKNGGDASFGNDDILSLLSENSNSALDVKDKDEEDVTFEDDDILGLLSENVNSALDSENKDEEDVTFEDDDVLSLLSEKVNSALVGKNKDGTSKKYQTPVNIAECDGIRKVRSTFENECIPSLLSENVNSALGGGDKISDEILFFKAVVISFLDNIDLLPKDKEDVTFEDDDVLSLLSENVNSASDSEDKDKEDVTSEDDDVLSLLSEKVKAALDCEDKDGTTSNKYQTPVKNAECDAFRMVRTTFENDDIPSHLSENALDIGDKDEEDVLFEDCDILSLIPEKANSALEGGDKLLDEILLSKDVLISLPDKIDLASVEEEDVSFGDDDILSLLSENVNSVLDGEDKMKYSQLEEPPPP